MKIILTLALLFFVSIAPAQERLTFNRDFSPAEGLVTPEENPAREEICLNGSWDFQPVAVPEDWVPREGKAPELTAPEEGKWENVKIKIPSPWNVNEWGAGSNVGEGTNLPYAPSSVYFPSYPKSWGNVKMGWLKRTFTIPASWDNKRIILHFEAVAGYTEVYVNGNKVAENFDQHMPFDADITDAVNLDGTNELLVGIRQNRLFDKKHPEYKYFNAVYVPGSNTHDLVGIWQDVFLHAIPYLHVDNVFIKPWVSANNLEIDVELTNTSDKKEKVVLAGDIREWINLANQNNVLTAPEISWKLGNTAMKVTSEEFIIMPGETKKITIKTPVDGKLKLWSPATPNLYTAVLNIKQRRKTIDTKTTRFGWRELKIDSSYFYLNGEKIQCFGDIQHPFGAYICSRRFAWAWYKMIKDFGGNAVRPHAQPWPRVYYDLADEMGLMVLDETGLFGSSIALNLEEEETWERAQDQLNRLILRDRNHPSVIGWSAGNEMFAIALLNKPPKEVSDKWDQRLIELALSPMKDNLDPTRPFLTLDGDRDMGGMLPVWSKHFATGLRLEDLPKDANKPLIVGESGATYYGKPKELYQFVGEVAYESYEGRNEGLAVDVYQNVQQMAKPFLAYYSPSEVCWFGIEQLNLGYNDFSRLPNENDGVFAGKPYEEGKPGYQMERIPPYVTTFNPGIDPSLPLYKEMAMYKGLKAAMLDLPSRWARYTRHTMPAKPKLNPPTYNEAYFIGNMEDSLAIKLTNIGIKLSNNTNAPLVIIDGETLDSEQIANAAKTFENNKRRGGLILIMIANKDFDPELKSLLPYDVTVTTRTATAMENNKSSKWGSYFTLPDIYFADARPARNKMIMKQGLAGELVSKGTVELKASRTDWSLFNDNPENRKCAQILLYERLIKPEGAALISLENGRGTIGVSTINYNIDDNDTRIFWSELFSVMGISLNANAGSSGVALPQRPHDLLLDGPIDK